MSAGVAGAVVAAVAPSGLCSEGVFEAVPASDPALAPSLSVDVDEGPFALAMMSEREEKKHLIDIYPQSIVESCTLQKQTCQNCCFHSHILQLEQKLNSNSVPL